MGWMWEEVLAYCEILFWYLLRWNDNNMKILSVWMVYLLSFTLESPEYNSAVLTIMFVILKIHNITNSITQSIPLVADTQLITNFLLLWNPKIHHWVHRSPSMASWIQSRFSQNISLRSILLLSSNPYLSLLSCLFLSAFYPHLFLFNYPNNIIWA
jgi:hypothetical protein